MADREKRGAWLQVFCPQAQCLTEEEVAGLPGELKQAPGVAGKDGLWLKVFCPDDACLTEGERPTLPPRAEPMVFTEKDSRQGGLWLKLFCPDNACLAGEDTDLA